MDLRMKLERHFPRARDLAPLLHFATPEFNATKRRLQNALTIHDLRAIAPRRTPKAAFDYAEGAAVAEISLARARQAFEDIQFNPAILRDVSVVDTSSAALGGLSARSAAHCRRARSDTFDICFPPRPIAHLHDQDVATIRLIHLPTRTQGVALTT